MGKARDAMRTTGHGSSRNNDVSAHSLRMALGRQQRQLAGIRTETREQQTANGMLHDFASSGIDEDLEILRAGWSSNSTAAAQRRGGTTPDFMFNWSDEPPSELNSRGDVAQRRLKNIQYLRGVAGAKSPSSSTGDFLCLTNGTASMASSRSSASSWRSPAVLKRGERRFSSSLDDLFGSDLPFRLSSTTSALTNRSKRRWRGPLDADSSSEEEEALQPMLEYGAMMRSQNLKSTLRRKPDRTEGLDDPWSAWESRWAEAFKEFDAHERARQAARLAQEEEERQRLWEEASKARDDAKRQQERSKATARAREEEARRKAKAESAKTSNKPSGESRENSKPYQGSSAGSSKSSTALPEKAPPEDKRPNFASFEAYESAWSKFEGRMKSGTALSFSDIPWPTKLPTISGASTSDSTAECKKKLRGALLRWHPDKWTPILNLVAEVDKAKVTEEVKEVTRRILAEKERFGG